MKRLIAALAGTAVLALAGCGGDDESDVQAFCDQAQEAQASSASLAAPLASGDLDAAKVAMDEVTGQLEAVADEAPDEISDDFEVVTSYNTNLNDQLQQAESPKELSGVLQEVSADSADVEEASASVKAYIDENCGDQSS
ncbi:MAG: hypothetical protein ABI726_07800 [bacterium]